MRITATHIAYLITCKRKLWLFHHGIQMEQESVLVQEGRLIGEASYPDRGEQNRQVTLDVPLGNGLQGVAVVDYFNPSTRVVHETKKSDRMEEAHVAQVKFYLWLLKRSGVAGCEGVIEYPKLRERTRVPALDEADELAVTQWVEEVVRVVQGPCPPTVRLPVCKQCAYYEYCFIDEA